MDKDKYSPERVNLQKLKPRLRGKMADKCVHVRKEPETLKGLVVELAQNTGMHGVPNIQRSTNWPRRVLWLCIVGFGISMMTWKVIEAFEKYYRYPVDTKINFYYSSTLDFPAVSICNMNPFRLSQVSQLSDQGNEGSMKVYLQKGVEEKSHVSNRSTIKNWYDDEQDADYHDQQSDDYSFYEQYLAYYVVLGEREKINMGHSLRDMMLSCSYNGRKCSPRNFTRFGNSHYGNCYMFNHEAKLTSRDVGPLHGLSLELYIEQNEYISGLAESAGIRVTVHNQSVMPFPEDNGFSAKPGTKTSAGITRTDVSRAYPPYGPCQQYDKRGNEQRNAFLSVLDFVDYTSAACKKTCYQKSLLEKCRCYNPNFPYDPNITAFRSLQFYGEYIKPCTNLEEKDQLLTCVSSAEPCVDSIDQDYQENKLPCSSECPVECIATEYTVILSSSMYPSSAAETAVFEKLLYHSKELNKLLENSDNATRQLFVSENVVKLEVYFEDLNYKDVRTEPSYKSLDLMSDIGGQAGLWLGMSVISLFEVVELVMVLFGLVCAKLITRSAKTHDANSDAKRDKFSSRRDDKYSAFTPNLSRT